MAGKRGRGGGKGRGGKAGGKGKGGGAGGRGGRRGGKGNGGGKGGGRGGNGGRRKTGSRPPRARAEGPATESRVEAFLRHEAGRPLKPKEISIALGLDKSDYPDLKDTLRRLERRGRLYRVRGGRYGVPDDLGVVLGRLQVIESGSGFVIPDEGDQDIYVRRRDMGSAIDRDRVAVRVDENTPRGPQGTIIEVIERAQERVVGIVKLRDSYGRLEVTEPRVALEVYLPQTALGGAEDGDLALVEITDWGERGDRDPMPAGRVERVLGRPGDAGADVLAIQLGYGFDHEFPHEVEDEARTISRRGIRPEDLEGREDFRQRRVVTIDPEDAKDHDDAVSIDRLDDGSAWIGVHIADVGHYVTRGSAIDDEAWERGTSVYLVDRVIPMLPHALSTDLCSLVPDEDRLTLTAMLRVNGKGEVLEKRFAKGVIRSRHRLSYERAQDILNGGDGSTGADGEEAAGLSADLRDLLSFSRAIRQRRLDRGSLDFDLTESRVIVDAEGAPIDVLRVERLPAHELIEDLMIAANEAVARWSVEEGVPLLYRIHEDPNPEKLEELRVLAAEFGHSFPAGGGAPRDFQRLLDAARNGPEYAILSIAVLRSMAKARYATSNEGHFGLASQAYLHFTSPIRRYPDLVVHRQLGRWLADQRSAREIDPGWLESTAKQSSAREKLAQEAERDSIDLKKVEFMERHLGDTFEGTISGVAPFGFFVRLDRYDIDGLVHVSSLGDDYYKLEEGKHRLRGRRTRRSFRLGDPVEVQVVRVDREERKIDFDVVTSDA